MRRKSLEKANCPIARSLERVGEWWSILILRDALHGYTRFDQFQKSLSLLLLRTLRTKAISVWLPTVPSRSRTASWIKGPRARRSAFL